MTLDVIYKLRLCISEMLCCMKLLSHTTEVDEFCAHLLGIYVTIRMDDFTKLVSINISQTDSSREYFNILLKQYNDVFRSVRDKLGSHFQHVEEPSDISARIDIFASLEYKNIVSLVDDVKGLYEMLCKQAAVEAVYFEMTLHTEQVIIQKCSEIYMDDVAHLGVDAFAIGSKNTGCLICCSVSQQKAQLIKSLQLMADTIEVFCQLDLNDKFVNRMFKRYYVCTIVNFYDNLVTRNISTSTDQYEEAFDKHILNLDSKIQSKQQLQNFYDDFHKRYQLTPKIERLRNTRNKSCGHFDQTLTIEQINQQLDTVTINELIDLYKSMRNFWEYLVNHVFFLKMVAIPARSPLYDAQFVSGIEQKTFYQHTNGIYHNKNVLSMKELWKNLVKHRANYEESKSKLASYLKKPNSKDFMELTTYMMLRLRNPSVPLSELVEIRQLVMTAKHGFPDAIQQFLLDTLCIDHDISTKACLTMLYLLTHFAEKEDTNRIENLMEILQKRRKYIERQYGCLMLLHYTIFSEHVFSRRKDSELDKRLIDFIGSVKRFEEVAAILVGLCSYWFLSSDYCVRVKEKTKITAYFEMEVKKAVERYLVYIKADDETKQKFVIIIDTHRFIQVNYILASLEEQRNSKSSPFKQNIQAFGVCWETYDCYEQMYQALGLELLGDKQRALKYMQYIADKNPLDKQIQRELSEMKYRIN